MQRKIAHQSFSLCVQKMAYGYYPFGPGKTRTVEQKYPAGVAFGYGSLDNVQSLHDADKQSDGQSRKRPASDPEPESSLSREIAKRTKLGFDPYSGKLVSDPVSGAFVCDVFVNLCCPVLSCRECISMARQMNLCRDGRYTMPVGCHLERGSNSLRPRVWAEAQKRGLDDVRLFALSI